MVAEMREIFAIDPGNEESAYALLDRDLRPAMFAKTDNKSIMIQLETYCQLNEDVNMHPTVAIEMVACYGMPVGREVFETCVWIGRFIQCIENHGCKYKFIYRKDEKMNLCHSMRATDATITQALVDRFASGVSNHGKGRKDKRGWFYGFNHDVWQAYAVGVTYHDMYQSQEE